MTTRLVHNIAVGVALATMFALCGGRASAAPILNPANGHYYEVITKQMNWATANAAATSSFFMGAQGHLATVTSAQENLFLTSTFGGGVIDSHWLGGFQPPGSPEPAGGWAWVTGEPFAFNNWFPPAEPNNAFGTEDRIQFAHGILANGKAWNDATGANLARGYIVEFAPLAVPLPPTVLLFAGGLLGAFACRRRL